MICNAPMGSVIGVCGLMGEGKTTLVTECIRTGRLDPCVAFVPTAKQDRFNGKPQFDGEQFTVSQSIATRAWFERDRFVIVPDKEEVTEGKNATEVIQLARRFHGWTVVLDDCADYADEMPYLRTAATRAGHYDTVLILLSQSVLTLSRNIRRHLSHLVIFTAEDEADIQDLKKRGGQELVDLVQGRMPDDPPVLWTKGMRREIDLDYET